MMGPAHDEALRICLSAGLCSLNQSLTEQRPRAGQFILQLANQLVVEINQQQQERETVPIDLPPLEE